MGQERHGRTGLRSPVEKLISAVRTGTGILYDPAHIKRAAAPKTVEVKGMTSGIAEVKAPHNHVLAQPAPLPAPYEPVIDLDSRLRQRLLHQEVRLQNNLDQVVAAALASAPEQVSEEAPDTSWLSRFFATAAEIDDEKMQEIWGKILAGEVSTPGRFSLRALDVLRNLSRREAELFAQACELSTGINEYIMLIPKPPGTMIYEDEAAMARFLSFGDRLQLADAGLIRSDTLHYEHHKMPARIYSNGRHLELSEIPAPTEAQRAGSFGPDIPTKAFPVLMFSEAGKALGTLIRDNFNHQYFSSLASAYEPWGIRFTLLPTLAGA
jgi:hypothetical protein